MNFDIPSGLTDLLQEFTVAVLRQRPSDLYLFAADYFGEAYERRRRAQLFDDEDGDKCADKKEVSFGANRSSTPPHENNISDEDDDDDEIIGS